MTQHAGHGLVELGRSYAVMDGAVRLDERGKHIAGLDEPPVLGVAFIAVPVRMQGIEAVELFYAAFTAAGVVELRMCGEAEVIGDRKPRWHDIPWR